ncbi:MAG: hypothetical protein EPO07_05215 [Verrucomicrobia bacterium]|nr:MAG: hypothetical protein EPO07_05215 [Verrucomicrobiota bacterium]
MPDESFEQEIAKLQAHNRDLAAHLEALDRKFEADARRDAYYFHLVKEKERMEREIAAREGRPHQDDDDPDGTTHPEPPEDDETA